MSTISSSTTTSSNVPAGASIVTSTTNLDNKTDLHTVHKEPRDALDNLNEPSIGSRVTAAASNAASSISAAAQSAAHSISEKAHDIDTRYHLGEKARDAASFAGNALKQGNPLHAMKHAGTAATIGEAERAKHEAGPLPEGAHAANTETGTVSGTHAQSATGPSTSQPQTLSQNSTLASAEKSVTSTATNIGTRASDAASFAGAALKEDNPVFAAQYAGTAAMIGQAERDKHAAGNMQNEADIRSATQ